MKKTIQIIHTGLHPLEADIANKMRTRGENISEMIRSWFRAYGAIEFPPAPLYALVQKERLEFKKEIIKDELVLKKMTPEEYAGTILKARISKGMAWLTTVSTQAYPIPLSKVKEWNIETDLVMRHLKIINNEEVYALGAYNPMSDQDRATAIKNWEKA